MRALFRPLLLVVGLWLAIAPAMAQTTVVSDCSTAVSPAYTAGARNVPYAIDTAGKPCSGGGTGASSNQVQGAGAHDAAIAGNPVRVGARAVEANVTAVTAGDTADLMATTVGALVQRPFSIPEADWSYAATASGIVNTTTAVTIKAAGAAGLRNYITGLQVATDTLGAATELAIRDGAAGTVLWRGKLQTGPLALMHIQFPSPLRGSAATLLEVVTLTAVTGGVYVNAQGYVAP